MRSDHAVVDSTQSRCDFDGAIAAYRKALGHYMQGDPGPVVSCFSDRDDVTLANPLGQTRRGAADVHEVAAAGAAHFVGGSVRGIEEVSRYSTADLGYVVEIERSQARLSGSEGMSMISLRVTMVFRREGDTWNVVHRHADPITTPRPISTAIEAT